MPGCGWRTFKEEETEALTLRHSLLQKLQLKYTRSLVDRFKIPLDISIVDNTSDGLVSILFLAQEARYLYDVKCRKTQSG